jgi:PAS domain S-box-containing protein
VSALLQPAVSRASPANFIVGVGEMPDLVRAHAWESTPLGPICCWSDVLLSHLNLVLSAPYPAAICWGPELTFLFNDASLPFLDRPPEQALGLPYKEIFRGAWPRTGPDLTACLDRGRAIVRENFVVPIAIHGEPEDFSFTYSVVPIFEKGHIAGVYHTYQDTPEASLARRDRDAATEKLFQVMEAICEAVIIVDRSWIVTYLNQRASEVFAARPPRTKTALSDSFPHMVDAAAPFMEHYRRAMHQAIPARFETFYTEPFNRWFEIDVQPSKEGIILFINDVTETRRAQHEVAAERANLAALFEQAPVSISLIEGPEHVYQMVNQAHQRMLGNRNVIGRRVVDAFPEAEDQGFVRRLDQVHRTGRSYSEANACIRLERGPGQPAEDIFIDYVYQPRFDQNGDVSGVISICIDRTERHRTEQALIQSEKLAAVGRLASSVAHEINNPLTSVLNYLYLISITDNLGEIRAHLNIIEAELRRVTNISQQTLLSQKQIPNLAPVAAQDLIEGVLALHQGRLRNARVKVETSFRAHQPIICLEGEIRQVLGNLIVNAIDAMQVTGGRLLIHTREITDVNTGRKTHRLTIADTGPGIPEEVRNKIFEPFFTTKGAAGNGLGLWVSLEIVKRHQGRLKARSAYNGPCTGTVFTLHLPLP